MWLTWRTRLTIEWMLRQAARAFLFNHILRMALTFQVFLNRIFKLILFLRCRSSCWYGGPSGEWRASYLLGRFFPTYFIRSIQWQRLNPSHCARNINGRDSNEKAPPRPNLQSDHANTTCISSKLGSSPATWKLNHHCHKMLLLPENTLFCPFQQTIQTTFLIFTFPNALKNEQKENRDHLPNFIIYYFFQNKMENLPSWTSQALIQVNSK